MTAPTADARSAESPESLRREAELVCAGLLRSYGEAARDSAAKDAEIARLRSTLRDLRQRILRAMH